MIPSSWTWRNKILISVVVLSILLLFSLWYLFGKQKQSIQNKGNTESLTTYAPVKKQTTSVKQSHLMVDVKGAVKQPGIYRLPTDARVYQAVQAAGGFLDKSDQKQVNLAQKCKDEMVIYVPALGETPPTTTNIDNVQEQKGKININTASSEELDELDSIGPAKAEAIVKYRETNGPFQAIDELSQVPGIGEKTIEKFRDRLTLY